MEPTDRERMRRIGLNEAIFREVNERVEAISDTLKAANDTLLLVCECGDSDCMERIQMPRVDYEELRSDPALFATVPGHAAESVESVVARRAAFDVVRKHRGLPEQLAVETDPR
jgi:hypothetical protein